MRKFLLFFAVMLLVIAALGCDKEKIVTTTETVTEIEYIQTAPDTVIITVTETDTVYQSGGSDTVIITETDTVYQTNTIIDTVTVTNTVYHTDTVTVTNTVYITDTVETTSNTPNEYYAYTAMQYHSDPEVLAFIDAEFGYSDGWVLYLSTYQSLVENPGTGVYDIWGFIDYWTPDYSGYYPIEYGWRVTYNGGDPSNPQNWTLTEPPTTGVSGNSGLKISTKHSMKQ